MRTLALGVAGALLLAACGKSASPTAPVAAAPPLGSGVDRSGFDMAVRAQDDFYRHVNGTWLREHPVPADKSDYGSFTKLADDAEAQLRVIIEEAAAEKNKRVGSDEQKVGDFYRAFMDEARVESLGIKPLEVELARIDALEDRRALAAQIAHLMQIGVALMPLYVTTDAKNSAQYKVYLSQGGTGLPDRDFYLDPGERFAEIRARYRAHIGNLLRLAGVEDADAHAENILALETRLAEKQWTRVDSRDRDKTYNSYAFDDLPKLMPNFDWRTFVEQLDIGRSPGVVVMQPSFFVALDDILQETPLSTLKMWMTQKLLTVYADYLPQAFVDEHFAFYGATLNGVAELKPRWKRGVDATQAALGEVLGRIYVARHFSPAAKARMEELVQNLVKAYAASIRELDWMSDATKEKALVKLGKFTPKIGYPDKWKDYSALDVRADDLVGNVMRSRKVEAAREAAKLGGPIDRDEWHMTPQTVNAYYNPGMNEIVFPAAILQPPFFDMNAEDAVNYGGIGAVIGHEIGHGFDDQGSKYDGDGNLRSWWTEEDRKRFEERTKALIAQYDAYEALPGHFVNGAFSLGENIGDLGGLSIALKAYLSAHPEPPVIDGFTGVQRVLIGWAQIWRRNYKDENLLQRLKSAPHAPSEFRTNGVVRNIPEWYEAFDVGEQDALYLTPEQRVKIW